jgi:hypothetical protein
LLRMVRNIDVEAIARRNNAEALRIMDRPGWR